jgi:hypothetical protein
MAEVEATFIPKNEVRYANPDDHQLAEKNSE